MIGVVKVGGARGNRTEPLVRELAERVASGERWVLVHGASGAMDDLCRREGVEVRHVVSPSGYRSRFVGEPERRLFERAAREAGEALVGQLGGLGVPGKALRPARAARKECLRSLEEGRVRLVRGNRSGSVTEVDPRPLEALLDSRTVPVLPPLGRDDEGLWLNVDGDRLAAAAARALGAEVLVILSNVPGLLADPQDPESRIPSGDLEGWEVLEGAAKGNMKRKLLACREALEGGVPRVVLGDGRVEAPLGAALSGRGTQLWAACCTAVGA